MENTFKFKTGDILHCYRNTLVSKLIKLFTKSKYSHTATIVMCWGQPYVIDVQNNGVQPKPLEYWLKKYKYKFIIARHPQLIKPEDQYARQAFAKVSVNKYDYISLLFIHPIYALTGIWLAKGDPDRRKDICSEYVARLYDLKSPEKYTPKDMYNYTVNKNFKFYNYKK
ncbi:MAG: hypothetical protein KDH96_07510 [Candidatus Riesia sp.]|nr:hypothetical protein [Candidatus Riesia sp.]